MLNERDLYPECVDVGLSAALQVELTKLETSIQASWFEPLALWASAEQGARKAQVAAAAEERAFSLSLWAEGVEFLVGWSSDLALVAAAIYEWLSAERPGGQAMTERFSFLELEPLARAYERGEAIEYVWGGLLDWAPVDSMKPLIEAAAAEPRLRRLRPWTSTDRLCFSRWVGWPFLDDLPYAAPREGHFRVWRANDDGYLSEKREFVLGEGDAARAIAFLVDAIPESVEIVYRRPNKQGRAKSEGTG